MKPRKAFPLRINPALYDALERWAAAELRSVNGQIEFLLAEAVRRQGRLRETDGQEEPTDNRNTDEEGHG